MKCAQQQTRGGMAEWPIAPVLKTGVVFRRLAGSNPVPTVGKFIATSKHQPRGGI